jgi:hypothetical protein
MILRSKAPTSGKNLDPRRGGWHRKAVALERGEFGLENSGECHENAVMQVAAWLASRVRSSKQQQWCRARKKWGKENKEENKGEACRARGWAAPGKLGWAAQGEKERKSGLRTREANGPNSKNSFVFYFIL